MKVTIEQDDGSTDVFEVNTRKGEVVEALRVEEVDNVPCGGEAEDAGYSCTLCGGTVHPENDWCFGCRSFVCIDHPQTPFGTHEAEDHDAVTIGVREDDDDQADGFRD